MKKFFNVKTVSLILAVVLLVGGAVGGTLAWIIDKTDAVTNTFTYGDINITLTEDDVDGDGDATKNKYEMIPGEPVIKNPTVTVLDDSEACWLFVELVESGGATIGETTYDFDDYLSYTVDSAWTALDEATYPGVYYREVPATTKNEVYTVISDNKLTVPGTVTKEMLNALDADPDSTTYPTLTVTAYAVQKSTSADLDTAAEAWAIAKPISTNP